MRRDRVAAALLSAVIAAAPLAYPGSSPSGCAAMSCCAGRGAFCPMHAPSDAPSLRSCRSNPDALPSVARVTLSLPVHVAANDENHSSQKLADVSAPRTLWHPTEPGVPPPERLA